MLDKDDDIKHSVVFFVVAVFVIGLMFSVVKCTNSAMAEASKREQQRLDEFQQAQAWLVKNCKQYQFLLFRPKYICLKYGIISAEQLVQLRRNQYLDKE